MDFTNKIESNSALVGQTWTVIMAGTYKPMATYTYMTTYRSNDKCQSGNFTKPVLLKYKLLRQRGYAFKPRRANVLCALLDMAVLKVMRRGFQVKECTGCNRGLKLQHVSPSIPHCPLHFLPYFSSLPLTRNPEARCKKTACRHMTKVNENPFHLQCDENSLVSVGLTASVLRAYG
jgi:hypothetical protein